MFKYLRSRIGFLCLSIGLCLILTLYFLAIGVEIIHIYYPLFLCLLAIATYMYFDYKKFKNVQNCFSKIGRINSLKDIEELLYHAEYIGLYNEIDSLSTKLSDEINTFKNQKNELLSYLMLWSHQIKIPISSLLLMAERTDEAKKFEIEIYKINDYIKLLINMLKLNDIHNDISIENINLHNLIEECIKYFSPHFIAKNLSVDIKNCDINILSDKKLLRIALEQILSNSCKYSSNSKVEIYFDNYKLYIKDHGIGIAKEDISRIFERSFSGLNGKIDNKSSGIGLFVAQKVLGVIGFKLDCTSQKGKGTTMIIDMSNLTKL